MNAALLMVLFAALMIAALWVGVVIRSRLPEHHRTQDSREAVSRAVGVVVTLTSLVLGLVVGSAHDYFKSMEDKIVVAAADMSALDAILASYGPESAHARQLLRSGRDAAVASIWPERARVTAAPGGTQGLAVVSRLSDAIHALPRNDARQAALLDRATALVAEVQSTGYTARRLEQASVQTALIGVLLSWLVLVYLGLGLVMPPTPVAIISTALAATACAGGLFLVLEFYSPVSGLVQISPSILESALAR
jgi:hypothetical protein